VLNAGASGYIPKSATAQTVVSALQLVLSGNVYVPPLMLSASRVAEPGSPAGAHSLSQLTDRQVDVLRYLRDGLSNKEISANLGIAEKTVKVHIAAIFKTLNVVNRTQAAKFLHDARDVPGDAR
jgi:DNA-binding NarL/FixJ family response regulator